MIGFSQDTAKIGNIELVPQGTLSRAILSVEKQGFSKPNPEKGTAGGGEYYECKITLVGAPYEKRTIFHYLLNPEDPKHTQQGRDLGLGALVRMLEATGVFEPANPASYRSMTFRDAVGALLAAQGAGKTIAIEVGVQKGTGGYQDKNVIRAFLSPNPKSDSYKKWQKLQEGGQAMAAPALPASGFMQSAPDPVAAAPAGFGSSAPGWLGGGGQATKPMDDAIPF